MPIGIGMGDEQLRSHHHHQGGIAHDICVATRNPYAEGLERFAGELLADVGAGGYTTIVSACQAKCNPELDVGVQEIRSLRGSGVGSSDVWMFRRFLCGPRIAKNRFPRAPRRFSTQSPATPVHSSAILNWLLATRHSLLAIDCRLLWLLPKAAPRSLRSEVLGLRDTRLRPSSRPACHDSGACVKI